jgi:hypothetical protein
VSGSGNDRFFISYLGNGSKRNLSEASTTRNYIPDGSFLVNEERNEIKLDTTHRINFGLRKTFGTRQNIIMNGGLSYNSASNPVNSLSGSLLNGADINRLERNSNEIISKLSGNADASYLLKINDGKTIFRISGRAVYSGDNSDTRFTNRTEYLNPYRSDLIRQFYNLKSMAGTYSGALSLTQKVTKKSFLDFSFSAWYTSDEINRKQGNIEGQGLPDAALSPDFLKTGLYFRPGITWKVSTPKTQLSVSVLSTAGNYKTTLNNDEGRTTGYFYLSPGATWEYDYRSGRRIMTEYRTSVNTPEAYQLLPVVNNLNPLSLFYGNRDLIPEYNHNARLTWWLFDQFSFTTLLTSLNFRYTRNKIGYERTVTENLGQIISLRNVRDDWNAGGDIDFSTPIKSLGLKINLSLSESYNRGISFVNGTENINRNLIHRIALTFDNRKKDKWDIETGSTVTFTDSKYSVQKSLNNVFSDISWFSEIRYAPNVHLNFLASADITSYSARSFSESQLVPLMGAEVSYYFLRNQRGAITLSGKDLLNKNTGIERLSELNYLIERRSDILGRYVLLSFKYRLNKVGDGKGGIDIQVKSR